MIGDTTNFAEYAGNASTSTPYVIPFRFDAADWVKVTVTTAAGVVTEMEQTTHYTLGGTGSTADGTFTTVVAVPSTSTLRVYREAPGIQSIDLETNTPLPAESLEAQLDRLAMAAADGVPRRFLEKRIREIELTPGPPGPPGPIGATGGTGATGPIGPSGATETTASIIAKLGGADGKIGAEVLPEPLALTEVPVSQVVTDPGTRQRLGMGVVSGATTGLATITVSGSFPGSPIVTTAQILSLADGASGTNRRDSIYAALNAIPAFTAVWETGSLFQNTTNIIRKSVNGLALANDPTALFSVDTSSLGGQLQFSNFNIEGVAGTGTPATPVPEYVGQTAIVTHSDGTLTEWSAVSPTTWLPQTAGIIYNRTASQWERTFIADGTIQTEILPNQ
jgi:hypothetical protein